MTGPEGQLIPLNGPVAVPPKDEGKPGSVLDAVEGGPLAGAVPGIVQGLTAKQKKISPRYFYDSMGSSLFERITQLPDYYLARSENVLIERTVDAIVRQVAPQEVLELGTGSSKKIRQILDACSQTELPRYTAFDIDRGAVTTAVETIGQAYPGIDARGVVGDFEKHLSLLPESPGRRLVVFFGSTIGNLDPWPRRRFLANVRTLFGPRDRFLLGVDLKKEPHVLEAAYNDAEGLTAEFNRNILNVVNRLVDANFDPEAFRHQAIWNEDDGRIEMHLIAETRQEVFLGAGDVAITVEPGETIWTESSYKFTRGGTQVMLEEAKMRLDAWHTDTMFGLALAAPDGS